MVYLVAEIGVNWDGDYDLLELMAKKSKEFGFNAIKLQAFNDKNIENHPEKNRLMKTTVSEKNIDVIHQIANSIGIEWLCTPMYPEAVDLIQSYVKKIKIRELDGRLLIENKTNSLLDKILCSKKAIIVSSYQSPKKCNFYQNSNISWLYCVPKYPCQLSDLDFSNFNDFDGYSNHSPLLITPITAAVLGAQIIEIHITEDKNKDYIDNNVSFDFTEMKYLTEQISNIEKIKRS